MTDEVNKDWSHWIRESDGSLTLSGCSGKRQTTKSSNTRTAVDTSPSTKIDAKTTDGKGVGRSYDKNSDPVRAQNRPGHLEFPRPQSISPTNPQASPPRNPGLADMWRKADLEQQTREYQRRQSGNYLNRKS